MAFQLMEEPGDYGMTRSPIFFYAYDPLYTGENGFYYVADVYVWYGEESAKPVTPALRLSRYPDASGGAAFDVSDVCNSFLDDHLSRENGAYFTTGCAFCQVEFGWIDNAGEHLIEDTSDIIAISKGFTGYMDGVNLDVAQRDSVNRWLTDRYNRIRIFEGCYFTLALTYKTTAYGAHYVRIWDDADGDSVRYDLNALIGTATDSKERILMFQCGMDWVTDPTDLASKKAFDTELYPIREYYVQCENAAGTKIGTKYTFEVQDCAPWGFYTIQFMNRYGVWDYLICEGRKKMNLQVESQEVFRNPLKIDVPGGITVDTPRGQYTTQVMGREGMVLNTGWMHETDNELIKQLLMSKRVMCGESDGKSYQPLNVKMTAFEEKTQLGERLINYELTLTYANDYINSVK